MFLWPVLREKNRTNTKNKKELQKEIRRNKVTGPKVVGQIVLKCLLICKDNSIGNEMLCNMFCIEFDKDIK